MEKEYMSTFDVEYSLVIPMRNELENIAEVLRQSLELIKSREDLEIIIVDNGSTDGSNRIFANFSNSNTSDRIKLVRKETNTGYGDGILYGLKFATGNWFGWTHGDLQTDLMDNLKAFQIAERIGPNKPALIKGKRIGRSLTDRSIALSLSLLNYLINGIFLHDINGQPNWIQKKHLQNLKNIPSDSTFELKVITALLRNDSTVNRFEVNFPKRLSGTGANEHLWQKLGFTIKSIRTMWNSRR